MKNLTLLLNSGALIFIIVASFLEGLPSLGDEPIALLSIATIFFTLFMNIYYISHSKNEGLISVYLQRKILEEKNKIKNLSEDK